MSKYIPVIGLEVHVELKTKSKMFCGCSTEYFGNESNTHTCPVCLGLPGALPVANKTAIEWCIKIGIALNCKISLVSKFDRKNYFYPDLAKGYQISQYDKPFANNGYIILRNKKKIDIRRVHMEEDTAKLTHQFGDQRSNLACRQTRIKDQSEQVMSVIDFNRSGVPLVEVVTEPDFESGLEVKEYLQKLQQIIKYLGVSDADMEKGEMRMEPNISIRETTNNDLPSYKVEVKNINSFRFVEKAINYEINRQRILLEENKIPVQETRGWDEKKQRTFSQRVKEDAQDYRYFPEPDIPPIYWTEEQISKFSKYIPELPDERLSRFQTQYCLPYYDIEILIREKQTADYFEKALFLADKEKISAKDVANWMINKNIDINKITQLELVKQIVSAKKIAQVDESELGKIIKQVLFENEKAVEDYKKGKQTSIMFLLGQTMRRIGKKVDATIIREKIEKELQ